MSGRKPTQDEVARVLKQAILTANKFEDELGEMSRDQHQAMVFALLGFWKATDIQLHDGMSGKEFRVEFQSFVEGYLNDDFNEEPSDE